MSQSDSSSQSSTNEATHSSSSGRSRVVLCPYCGNTQQREDRCEVCGGLFEPLSRMATQIAMGPWYIRDKAHPFRPGFSFKTLLKMIDNGRINATTIIRGPSTHQFWSVARNTPGVAHLIGYCHHCGDRVQKDQESCDRCGAGFRFHFQRDHLGLQYPDEKNATAAQRKLEALQNQARKDGDTNADVRTEALHTTSQAEQGDLLQKALGLGEEVNITQGGANASESGVQKKSPAVATSEQSTPSQAPADAASSQSFPGQLDDYRNESPDIASQPVSETSQLYAENVPAESQSTGGGSSSLSKWVWVMLVLNILAALAVVVLFFFSQGK